MMFGWHEFGGHPFMGGVFMFLFWGLLLLAIVFLLRFLFGKTTSQDQGSPCPETAIDILKKRYAQGEISKEEFEEKMEVLNQFEKGVTS